MIFDNNATSLGAVNIPMAEGYDCSYGAALALVESAQNEYAMFRGLLDVEAKALAIHNESASYVNEAEYVSLQEAAVSGIWNKIKELFSKLVAKIKAIFHTFMSKINSLFMSDKKMVKKYEKEILRKINLSKMEVKWSKIKKDILQKDRSNAEAEVASIGNLHGDWNKDFDTTERIEFYLKKEIANCDKDSFAQDYHDEYFEEEETMELGETGESIRGIMTYLNDSKKVLNKVQGYVNKLTTKLEKFVSESNKFANEMAKAKVGDRSVLGTSDGINGGSEMGEEALDSNIKYANETFEMAQAYQSAQLMISNAFMEAHKFKYKMYKAVFMKAIAANDKKLEESAVYADAFAEAAANEVTDVLDRAISDEELSKICNASKSVLDGDVSDDPDKLTYGQDAYTPNRSYVATAGYIDSKIDSKSESFDFGRMLY